MQRFNLTKFVQLGLLKELGSFSDSDLPLHTAVSEFVEHIYIYMYMYIKDEKVSEQQRQNMWVVGARGFNFQPES